MERAKKKFKHVRKRQRNSKPMIARFLIIILSQFGMISQTYITITSYMEYKQVSEVKVKTNIEPVPPAVSLCFDIENVLPEGFNVSIASEEFINDNIFNLVKLVNEHFKRISAKQYFRRRGICVLVQRAWRISHLEGFGAVNEFFFNYNSLTKTKEHITIRLYIHQNDSHPSYTESHGLIYGLSDVPWEHNSYDLAFDLVTSKLLQPPYPDQCYDHRKDNLTTRGHCISLCRNKAQMKKYGGDPYEADLVTTKYVTPLKQTNESTYDAGLRKSMFRCEKQCKRNCTITSYFPILLDKYSSKNGTSLIVIYNTGPHFTLNSSPALYLGSLIIYLTGIIGAWTGISFLGITVSFVHVLWGLSLIAKSSEGNDDQTSSDTDMSSTSIQNKFEQNAKMFRTMAQRLAIMDSRLNYMQRTPDSTFSPRR